MPLATNIIRFVASEDGREHLGQPVDLERDVGLDTYNNVKVEAFLIDGDIYHPELTTTVLTVKHLLAPISPEHCNYIRCLGLNYEDHAVVRDRHRINGDMFLLIREW